MNKGDILICKKDCYCNGNFNIKNNKYIIKNICDNGKSNVNVYVSTDCIYGDGVSTPFSIHRDFDKSLPHSSFILDDYFISLVEFRHNKLKKLM